jgi:tetratricopeptide (TPR) repeat protein
MPTGSSVDIRRALDLTCPHCGGSNAAGQWPERGSSQRFTVQTAPSLHAVAFSCRQCGDLGYCVWPSDPGPMHAIDVDPVPPAPAEPMGHLRARDPDKALAWATNQLYRESGLAWGHGIRGLALGVKGDMTQAIGALETAVALDARLPNLHYNLGVLYLRASRAEDARRAFERELRLNPQHAQAAQALQRVLAGPSAEPPGVKRVGGKELTRGLASGNEYVDSCLALPFDAYRDTRNVQQLAEAQKIIGVLEAGNFNTALGLADQFRRQHADYAEGHLWLARTYRESERLADARDVLLDGLQRAWSRHPICTELGEIELDLGDAAAALRAWIHSATIQAAAGVVDDPRPFQYLHTAAEALHMPLEAERIQGWIDRAGEPAPLPQSKADKVEGFGFEQGASLMREALRSFCTLRLR